MASTFICSVIQMKHNGPPSCSVTQHHNHYPAICVSTGTEERKKDTAGIILGDKNFPIDPIAVRRSQMPTQRQTQMVDTVVDAPPLVSALKSFAEQDTACFHFPGHNRGRSAPSSMTKLIGTKPFFHDITPLPNVDNLFHPKRSILEAQNAASELFGSSDTWFLVGGTTCGIQAAIMATCSPGDYLILPRNSHISAISALVMSGVLPKYIVPEYNYNWEIASGIKLSQVKEAIIELEEKGCHAAAVFVTSPTYQGICSDLAEIAMLCHSHKIPWIVDEAHGAHFKFHNQFPISALEQGADISVQSTHKVQGSLSQSSMLHMAGDIVDRNKISGCLQLLQSTSPSYLLLASLDAARSQLSENPQTIFDDALSLAIKLKELIKKIPGISLLEISDFPGFTSMDQLRLTVGVWKLGLSGYEAGKILEDELKVIPELIGTRSLTFVINLGTCREHVQRLLTGLERISTRFRMNSGWEAVHEQDFKSTPFDDMIIRLNPRDAFFADKKNVCIRESIGKIYGELICPFPPGVPALFPGEIITEKAWSYLLDLKNKGAVILGASDPSVKNQICKTENSTRTG